MLVCRPQALEHLGRGLADLVGHFFALILRRRRGEVYEGADDVSRIKGDEGELDALTTYLEAVQVFLHQHMHSRNDALLQHQLSPTCATVSFTPLGLWVKKIATMSYEMSRQRSALTEAHRMDRKNLL